MIGLGRYCTVVTLVINKLKYTITKKEVSRVQNGQNIRVQFEQIFQCCKKKGIT